MNEKDYPIWVCSGMDLIISTSLLLKNVNILGGVNSLLSL